MDRTAQSIANEIESLRQEQTRMLQQVGDWDLFANTDDTPNTDAILRTYATKIDRLLPKLRAASAAEYIAKGTANIGT